MSTSENFPVKELLREGIAAHNAGERDKAETIYRHILAIDPENSEALHMLGIASAQVGNFEKSATLIERAIKISPGVSSYHASLAETYLQMNRLHEAAEHCRQAVTLNQTSAELWMKFGRVSRMVGRLDHAITAYRATTILQPKSADARNNLGVCLVEVGRLSEAITTYREAIQLEPRNPTILLNLASSLIKDSQFDEAVLICRRAIEIDPNLPVGYQALGLALCESGRFEEAIAAWRSILGIDPNNAGAYSDIGYALSCRRQFDQAIDAISRALQIQPNHKRAITILGATLSAVGRHDEAIEAYRRLLRIDPDDACAHWDLALALLLRGDFVEGWREFEWRLRRPELGLDRNFPQQRWDGANLFGKTILLYAEGGFGDALQFVRYLPMVAERGGNVILECQRELVALFLQISGVHATFARGDSLSTFDRQIPLQSLPLVFNTTLANIPASVPYLSASPQKEEYWRRRIGSEAGLKVGLVWAGSNIVNDKRTHEPDIFDPLGGVPGVKFYSLQKGPASNEAVPESLAIKDFTADLHDFSDTAAFMANLDLIISVDTSSAHLAGAMAKPVWVLLPLDCDFRWMRDREDSPWYPTMQLFRQTEFGDWKTPVEKMAKALRLIVNSKVNA